MNIPSVPTDSLYKLLAISGVLIVVGADVLEKRFADEKIRTFIEVRYEEEMLYHDYSHLGMRFFGTADCLLEWSTGESPYQASKELVAELQGLQECSKALRERYEGAPQRRSLSEHRITQLTGWVRASRRAIPIGAIVGVLGLYRWYARTQRYQDAILRKRAETLSGPHGAEDDVPLVLSPRDSEGQEADHNGANGKT